jgi:hypothetical protein
MAMRKREGKVFPNAAGIDIGASSHWAALPRHLADSAGCDPVREVGAMTADSEALAGWLVSLGVDTMAVESTGVYWIPVFEVLEQHALKAWLVDARQLKYVPGRKRDVQDCQWLQKLTSLGLLRAAWRPSAKVCVLRAVARQRETLLTSQASWVQRMQKALVQMNIQIIQVLTDAMGVTGQDVVRDIVAGVRDPAQLARHRQRRVKATQAEIARALQGNWREEHLFVLKQSLAMYDDIGRQGTVLRDQALDQPGAPGAEDGRAELVAQRVGARSLLPPLVIPNGQAQGQHRCRAQAGTDGALHAHQRRSLRRPGPAALRRAAASAQHRCAQAPRCIAGLPDQSRGDGCMNSAVFISVSQEPHGHL